MRLGEKAKDSAVELVKRRAAQDILAAIEKCRDSSASLPLKQWIFGLVQNAVDVAKARGNRNLKIIEKAGRNNQFLYYLIITRTNFLPVNNICYHLLTILISNGIFKYS